MTIVATVEIHSPNMWVNDTFFVRKTYLQSSCMDLIMYLLGVGVVT